MQFTHTKQLNNSFEDVVPLVREGIEQEGFGILYEIDVQKTFKDKLNLDYGDYLILGVCNPALANKALSIEKEVGVFLPCNIIVYTDKGHTNVSTIKPLAALSIVPGDEIKEVGKEAELKLIQVIDRL